MAEESNPEEVSNEVASQDEAREETGAEPGTPKRRLFRSPRESRSRRGGAEQPGGDDVVSTPVAEGAAEEAAGGGPEKRRGFFSWFSSRKNRGEGADADAGEAAGEEDDGAERAVVQEIEIDKNAPADTQFAQACAAAALAASGGAVAGRDGWYFSARELEALAGGAGQPDRAPAAAAAEYARQLRAAGVQLVVVPVPPKAVIYPDEITKSWNPPGRGASRFDSALQTLYADLAARGVTVVDPTDAMLAQRDAKTGRMFPKSDSAWSPRAAELAAAMVAEEVRGDGWLDDDLRQTGITTVEATLSLRGDLAGSAPAETVPARLVKSGGAGLANSRSAPLLVLAGEDGAAFRDGGASFADQLAAELRVPFDLVSSGDEGRNVPRSRALQRSLSSPGYVTGRECVVWLVGGEEFLLPDWRFVPVDLHLQQGEEELRSTGG
jgi:alginate O-acetyltransferase complex protein AlgJ